MVRARQREYRRQPRTSWFLLLSILLHLLIVVGFNVPRWTMDAERPVPKAPESNPIRVSFTRPESTETPEKPEVFAETDSRAQTPEGPKAERAEAVKTILPNESQTANPPSPPSTAQGYQEPTPEPAPAPTPAQPKSAPEPAPNPPPPPPHRREVANATPPSSRESTPKPQAPAQPKRLAKLPEPAEQPAPQPPPRHAPTARPRREATQPAEQGAVPRFGRIPLLSGEDLEKYAQVRTSDQASGSGSPVSLDTKELKYLSYFAHIKRRIERVWGYPHEAISNGIQGQLHLQFVLRNDGQVKSVELLRSSGYKVLDKEAWDAVVGAGPFEAFPPTIPDDELHITARFTYVLDESARRVRVR
jgi:periplasmic protein TonB